MTDDEKKEKKVRQFLTEIGEDLDRQGVRDTPRRVAEMHESLKRLEDHLNQVREWLAKNHSDDSELDRTFDESVDDLVMVRNIQYESRCEHHLLPCQGKAHVAYLANGKIVGLSKIPRVVEVLSKRPQVQERMTEELADLRVAS